MHPLVSRLSLEGAFEATAVFSALFADRDDVLWLDSGPDGMSYLGAGEPIDLRGGSVWNALRRVPGGPQLGAVGWLGYELRAGTTGAVLTRPSRYPDAAFLTVQHAIAIDGATGAAELLFVEGDERIGQWRDEVEGLAGVSTMGGDTAAGGLLHPRERMWRETDDEYLANIAACQAAIRDGEAYQLCLTTEVEVAEDVDPLETYRRLRASSATHHGGLIRIGGVSLLSASPEQFLAIDALGTVVTKPIKGTRARSLDAAEDERSARVLQASEKERAENLMIVDLMRNDLGRVCSLGSVTVTELRARGLYAGAFAYVGIDGSVDLAMTIRSIVLDVTGATIGAGGGITALSVPAGELAEVKLKAAAMLAALGID